MPRLFAVPLPWRKKNFQTVDMSVSSKGTQMCGQSGKVKYQNLQNAVVTGRKWMETIIAEVNQDPTQWSGTTRQAYKDYFKADPVEGTPDVIAVRGVLSATAAGLKTAQDIAAICRWRGGGTSTQGYVKTHSPSKKGRIHVNLKEYKSQGNDDRVEQACIIVHEATHKFADTTDDAYIGSSKWPTLSTANSITCADSYTYFVRDCNNKSLFNA